MKNINKLLGIRIKRLRHSYRLTQHDLAARANISLKHLGELERGRGNPSLKCILNLALELNVSLSELFTFDLEEKSEEALRDEIVARLQTAGQDVLKLIHRSLNP